MKIGSQVLQYMKEPPYKWQALINKIIRRNAEIQRRRIEKKVVIKYTRIKEVKKNTHKIKREAKQNGNDKG